MRIEKEPHTIAVVNTFLERLNAHDADGIAALFADQIDWYVPGNTALPWVGPRSRRAEVANYFRTMWPYFEEGKSIVTPGNLVITGDDAVVFAAFTHTVKGNGRTFQTPVALQLTISGSKIVRLNLYEDTWVVSRAFFD